MLLRDVLHPSGRCGEQAKFIPRTGQACDADRVGVYRVPGSLVCCILYLTIWAMMRPEEFASR